MDVKQVSMVVMLMAACLAMVANAMSIPADSANDLELGSPDNKDLDERATWLDTRGLEEDFKELVFSALQELTNEHRISPDLVIADNSKQMKKRGRWQGFCFRRTRNGRFLPYICWKGDRK